MPLQAGHLMAEPYSWKSLVTGQPVLRLHTTAIRSSYVTLPPGRHVLKFVINAPTGYHVNIVSNTKFSFGDEEEIMPKLTDESCRFVEQATQIVKSLGEAAKNFSDASRQKQLLEQLDLSMSPLPDTRFIREKKKQEGGISKRNLAESFNLAVYEMLKKALGEQVDAELAFAWKVFLNDHVNVDVLNLKDRRPETSSTVRGSAKKVEKKSNQQLKHSFS